MIKLVDRYTVAYILATYIVNIHYCPLSRNPKSTAPFPGEGGGVRLALGGG